MKIAHIDDEIWDSGLTEYALTLAKAQTEAGHEVLFFAPKGSHAEAKARHIGLKTALFPQNKLASGGAMRALLAFKPQVLDAHTGASHSWAAVMTAFLPGKTALIRTRADARPVRKKPLASILWARTSGFIGANSRITGEFRALFHEAPPSATVVQGIADRKTPPDEPGSGATIGMIGRLDPVKGHECAIKAFALLVKELPQARLHIAGEDKNIKAADLQNLCGKLGVADKVKFSGRLPDIEEFMDGCALGIVPSLGSEAVSRSAIEWQRNGRPVLASRVGGMEDLVDNGVSGLLLPPGDAQALSAALLRLLSAPDKIRGMGAAARARYEKLFTPRKFAEDTLSFYEATLRHTAH